MRARTRRDCIDRDEAPSDAEGRDRPDDAEGPSAGADWVAPCAPGWVSATTVVPPLQPVSQTS